MDLSSNRLTGTFPESTFWGMVQGGPLQQLLTCGNRFSGVFSTEWIMMDDSDDSHRYVITALYLNLLPVV